MIDTAYLELQRKRSLMTKGQVAKEAGIHPYTYARILRDKRAAPGTIRCLMRVLELDPYLLFVEDKDGDE